MKESDEERKLKAKLTKKFQQLEEKMAALTDKKSALEKELAQPKIYEDQKTFSDKLAEFNLADKELKDVTSEWEKIFEQLESLNK